MECNVYQRPTGRFISSERSQNLLLHVSWHYEFPKHEGALYETQPRNPLRSHNDIVAMVEQGCKGESVSSIGLMSRATVLMPGVIPGNAVRIIVIVIVE